MVSLKSLLNTTSGGSHRQFLLPSWCTCVILSYFFAWLVISDWKLDNLYILFQQLQVVVFSHPSQGLLLLFAYLFSDWVDYFSEVHFPLAGLSIWWCFQGVQIWLCPHTPCDDSVFGRTPPFSFLDHTQMLSSTNFQPIAFLFSLMPWHKLLLSLIQKNFELTVGDSS